MFYGNFINSMKTVDNKLGNVCNNTTTITSKATTIYEINMSNRKMLDFNRAHPIDIILGTLCVNVVIIVVIFHKFCLTSKSSGWFSTIFRRMLSMYVRN